MSRKCKKYMKQTDKSYTESSDLVNYNKSNMFISTNSQSLIINKNASHSIKKDKLSILYLVDFFPS